MIMQNKVNCGNCLRIWMMRKDLKGTDIDDILDKPLGFTTQKTNCKSMLLQNIIMFCDALDISVWEFFKAETEIY